MAIIVEDGTGVENATSYASLELADAYLVPRGLWPAPPAPVTDPDQPDLPPVPQPDPHAAAKEAALIRAFDYLNTLDWLGSPVDWEQGSAWPRLDVPMPGTGPNNVAYIGSNVIPRAIKQAQMELAGLIYNGRDVLAPAEHGGKIQSISESSTETVDVISTSTSKSVTYADDATLEAWLPSVFPLLKPYLADVPGEVSGGFSIHKVARG